MSSNPKIPEFHPNMHKFVWFFSLAIQINACHLLLKAQTRGDSMNSLNRMIWSFDAITFFTDFNLWISWEANYKNEKTFKYKHCIHHMYKSFKVQEDDQALLHS